MHRIVLTRRERDEFAEIGLRPWHNSSDAQMSGTFINQEGGETRVRYNVGMRLRGTTSRAALHKSRRVNFPNDRPWRGRTAVNLNAIFPHAQELGSAMFRLAGLPAPRARAVRVLENNKPLGGADAFSHIAELDPLNAEYIRWQFPNDDNGNLYKGGGHADLSFLGDEPAAYAEKHFYAKQTNLWQNDYSDLIELLRTLGQAVDQIDIDAWMRHLAVHDLLGNAETSLVTGDKGDYALYAGKLDPRFTLIPYDLDAVLGTQDGLLFPLWRAVANPALDQLMRRPKVAARYWFHLEDLARTVFAADQLGSVIDRLVGDYLPNTEVNRLKSFAAKRCEFVLSHIPRELTVDTGLAKRDGFLFSDRATVKLFGQAPATVTVTVEVEGQTADWVPSEARWHAKIALRRGLNRLLVRALDAGGGEVDRQFADVWHGEVPIRPLGQRLTRSSRWTANQPLLVTKPLVVPPGITLTVDPGATVCFGREGRLLIEGQLLAEGDALRRIQFLRAPGTTGSWGGIGFSGSTTDNRLAHVDFHDTGSYSLAVTNSAVTLDHVQWHNTRTNVIWFQDASLTVRDCEFPKLSHSEHVRGIGIRAGGELMFARNRFGRTTGYNDIFDVSGGSRPGPILELYDNKFLGGSDDGLDLDGMDAHLEGNTFWGFHKSNPTAGLAAAITTGRHSGKASDITAIRNLFYDNDHHILIKEGGRLEASNNTFYGATLGAIAFDEPRREIEMPRGARLTGNIFNRNKADLLHLKPLWLEQNWVWLHVFDSIIRWTHDWFGERNLDADPMFANAPIDVRLRHGSPAIGTGPNGLDIGAVVPSGASISGEPATPTRDSNAVLTIGGPGITHYRYRINNGSLSSEYPVDEPIRLTNLPAGETIVEVIGKNSAGRWPPLGQATRSKPWTVDPSLSQVIINELLAWPNDGAEDQIELFNESAATADLSGVSLTDNPTMPRQFIFPSGSQLAAGAYLVLDSDLGFKLDSDGEGVWLFGRTGELLDSVVFGSQLRGHSIGRTGRTSNWTLTRPTLGAPNVPIELGQSDALRVADWTANPPEGERDAIELYNPSTLAVALDGMRLSSQPVGAPKMFVFPPLSFIGAMAGLTLDSRALGFKLPAAQGEIGLASADGPWLDHIVYGPQPPDDSSLANFSGVIISETMTNNRKTLADEDGDFQDWIEIHNTTGAPVSLDRFSLSDDPADPFKWSFPDITLVAEEHLLVFASGKDRREIRKPLRTPPPNIPGLRLWLDATNAHSLTVDAEGRVSRWQSATGIIAAQTDSARQPRTANDPLSGLQVVRFDGLNDWLSLQLLNDIRTVFVVAREEAHATSSFRAVLGEIATTDFTRGGDRVLYFHPHSAFAGEESTSRINGSPVNPTAARWPRSLCLVTSLGTRRLQASLIGSDRFSPDRNWHGDIGEVMIYNRQLSAAEIDAVEAWLMDKWALPAAALHANFRLGDGDERLTLTGPLGETAATLSLPPCPPDATIGVAADVPDPKLFAQPTPGNANTAKPYTGWSGSPRLSIPPGVYSKPIDLQIEPPNFFSDVRYSLDGSVPGPDAKRYTVPLRLAKPAVVRARVFQNGHLPGPVVTASYLIGEPARFPVVSLSTETGNLFDPAHGIYTAENAYREWERPAFFEWFEPGGERAIGQTAGLRIHGGWTRRYDQKSLRLYARARYGERAFDHRFFAELGIGSFRRLLLRNSGNGWKMAFMRDAIGHELTRGMKLDSQSWRPSIVYLNGRYSGIHNLRERIDRHFLASHHGVAPNEIDLLKIGIQAGDMEHWKRLEELFNSSTEKPAGWMSALEPFVDLDNLFDYVIAQVFLDNRDWPLNNEQSWRSRNPTGRWRWIPYDLDGILGTSGRRPWVNTLRGKILYFPAKQPPLFVSMMQALLKEPRGRERFVHRYTTHLQTTLSRARLLRVINDKQTLLAPEMARHIARWQPAAHSSPQSALPHRNPADWLAEVQVLRAFAEARHEHVWDDLQASFKLGAPATLRVADAPGLLGVEAEGLALPNHGGVRGARFFTRLPMRLALSLANGWRLAGWENNIGPDEDGRFTLKSDTTLQPQLIFEPPHRPMFQSIELADEVQLRLVFYGLAGRAHHIETSADLVHWQRFKTVAVPDREPLSLYIPHEGEPDRRFFRIAIEAE
ncbi:MAG: CotH kinase family protein [Verrucomicrobiota bacterium]|nr:CotH kinase family protein [Verrucomicrobiota bacterium]